MSTWRHCYRLTKNLGEMLPGYDVSVSWRAFSNEYSFTAFKTCDTAEEADRIDFNGDSVSYYQAFGQKVFMNGPLSDQDEISACTQFSAEARKALK